MICELKIIMNIQTHDPKDVKSPQKKGGHNTCTTTGMCPFCKNPLELLIERPWKHHTSC